MIWIVASEMRSIQVPHPWFAPLRQRWRPKVKIYRSNPMQSLWGFPWSWRIQEGPKIERKNPLKSIWELSANKLVTFVTFFLVGINLVVSRLASYQLWHMWATSTCWDPDTLETHASCIWICLTLSLSAKRKLCELSWSSCHVAMMGTGKGLRPCVSRTLPWL